MFQKLYVIYNNKIYKTKSTLRVGWEAECSPYDKQFNPKFLKRIRAYDNNSKEFDIDMNFKLLENNRYISDGNIETIVIPKKKEDLISVNHIEKAVIYWCKILQNKKNMINYTYEVRELGYEFWK